jgi:hypothetical protein
MSIGENACADVEILGLDFDVRYVEAVVRSARFVLRRGSGATQSGSPGAI